MASRSKIKDLQARLGGGAIIMGGMKPGATRPIRKKKTKPRSATLDHTVLNRAGSSSNRKRRRKKAAINFDDLEDDDDQKETAQFTQSLSSNMNGTNTKSVDSTATPTKKRYGIGGGGGMGGLLAKATAGGFTKKSNRKKGSPKKQNGNNVPSAPSSETVVLPKSVSHSNPPPPGPPPSSTLSSASNPLPSTKPIGNANPQINPKSNPKSNPKTNPKSTPLPNRGGMGGMMMVSPDMLHRNALKSRSKSPTNNSEDRMVEVVAEGDNWQCLRLFAPMERYLEGKKQQNGKGLEIGSFLDNPFGNMMQLTSRVKVGWTLTKLGKQDVSKLSLFILKNQLANQAQMTKSEGYQVTFQAPPSSNLETSPSNQPTDSVASKASNAKTLRYEVVEDSVRRKVVRLFAALEQYIETEPGPNGKGLVVSGHCDFDLNLETVGIAVGWKLSKLEKRNVIKSSKLMLRNQLMALASTAKEKGFVVTFVAGDAVLGSQSLPASPLMNSRSGQKPNIVPIAPITDSLKAIPQKVPDSKGDSKGDLKENTKDKNESITLNELTADSKATAHIPSTSAVTSHSDSPKKSDANQGVDTVDPLEDLDILPDFSGLSRLQTDPAADIATMGMDNTSASDAAAAVAIATTVTSVPSIESVPSKARQVNPATSASSGDENDDIKSDIVPSAVISSGSASIQSIPSMASNQKSGAKSRSKYQIIPKKAKALPATPSSGDEVESKITKRTKSPSKYVAPKTCVLVTSVSQGTKESLQIRLYQDFEKFFCAEASDGNKGFAVQSMMDNEFGNALDAIGVGPGWRVTECAGKALGHKMFVMLKNQMVAASKRGHGEGYMVTFEKPMEKPMEKSTGKSMEKSSVKSSDKSSTASSSKTIPSKMMENESKSLPPSPIKKSPLNATKSVPTKSIITEPVMALPVASPLKVAPSESQHNVNAKTSRNGLVLTGSTTTAVKSPSLSPMTEDDDSTKNTKSATMTMIATTTKQVPVREEKEESISRRKRSYEPPKSCEVIDDSESTKKRVRMYQEFEKFFCAEASDGNKGFAVQSMMDNEFGNALSAIGVGPGWRVTECAGKVLGHKMFVMLKNQIVAASKKDLKNGYVVLFEGPLNDETSAPQSEATKSIKTATETTSASKGKGKAFGFEEDEKEEVAKQKGNGSATGSQTKASKPKTPRTPRGRKSVEVVSSTETEKSVKLSHHIDKYIVSAAQKGPKGFKIVGFHKMFGDDLKGLGIEEQWRLIRIGAKDVDKCFYQMTKTNLDVEFRNNQNKGYQVTFAAPE